MKFKFLGIALLVSASSVNAAVTEQELAKYPIVSADTSSKTVEFTLNGKHYLTNAVNQDGESVKLSKGNIIKSKTGFSEYLVTGQIVIELKQGISPDEIANRYTLTLKQAYKQFYILEETQGRELTAIADELVADPSVLSATLDLQDTSIGIQ